MAQETSESRSAWLVYVHADGTEIKIRRNLMHPDTNEENRRQHVRLAVESFQSFIRLFRACGPGNMAAYDVMAKFIPITVEQWEHFAALLRSPEGLEWFENTIAAT